MEQEFNIDKKEAISLLRAIADALESGKKANINVGELQFTIPKDVQVGIEYESESGSTELEIEFEWSDSPKGRTGTFTLFTGANEKWYFNLKAPNGEIILASEAYNSKQAANNGIESVKVNADESNFDKRESSAGQPYFVLKAANNQIIGKSQMYKQARSRDNGIKAVISYAKNASVKEEWLLNLQPWFSKQTHH